LIKETASTPTNLGGRRKEKEEIKEKNGTLSSAIASQDGLLCLV